MRETERVRRGVRRKLAETKRERNRWVIDEMMMALEKRVEE